MHQTGSRPVEVPDLRDHYAIVQSAQHPQTRKLIEFWNARGPDGIVVGRDVPSRAIAPLLSHIAIWEPADGGRDLRIRLAGASLRRRFGIEIKGRLMSELFPPGDFRNHLAGTLQVLETGTPMIVDSRLIRRTVEELHLEIAVLPVRSPDRKTGWVLSSVFFFD